MARTRTKPSAGINVDFTNVESRVLLPEGEYHVAVAEVKSEVGSSSGQPYLAWKFNVISDDEKLNGQTLFLNTSLQANALWNLRNLLETLGVEVPNGPVNLDPAELVELEMIAVVEHESYEGRKRARVVDFNPLDDEDTEEEEDEPTPAPTATRAKGKTKKLAPMTAEEVMDLDEEELEEVVSKYGLKVDLSSMKTTRKKVNAVIDALEAAEMLADD